MQCVTNNSIKRQSFLYTQLNVKTVLFQNIQFSTSAVLMSNNSIWSIDWTLSGATTPGQSGPGSDGNEEVLRIPQSSSNTIASPSVYLVSYPRHSLWGVLPLCRGVIREFWIPSRLGQVDVWKRIQIHLMHLNTVITEHMRIKNDVIIKFSLLWVDFIINWLDFPFEFLLRFLNYFGWYYLKGWLILVFKIPHWNLHVLFIFAHSHTQTPTHIRIYTSTHIHIYLYAFK